VTQPAAAMENHPLPQSLQDLTRRHFFGRCAMGLGNLALASMLAEGQTDPTPGPTSTPAAGESLKTPATHHPARAKSIIYLFMAGGPSQLELFDAKPRLNQLSGQPIPDSFLEGKRFAFMDSSFKNKSTLLGSKRTFRQYGQSGATVSNLLPHTAGIVDDIALVKSCATNLFNHAPAKLFMNTGSGQFGRPSMGSWVTYGIGSESQDLPGFVVLQSGPRGPRGGAVNWSSGFLPTSHQGVPLRGSGDPILNLSRPEGISALSQRRTLDALGDLNLRPSFARNCLLARRLVERGVRFVQLYHTNWDSHGGPGETLENDLAKVAHQVDQGCAALVKDLKSRGLLDDVLVVWGGEFGRTPMGETREKTGRNHHIDAFTMWFAGAGIRVGQVLGQTDELGFNPVSDRAHVHDIHATLLHLLGLDHQRLTYRFQGRDFRLTDIHGELLHKLMA